MTTEKTITELKRRIGEMEPNIIKKSEILDMLQLDEDGIPMSYTVTISDPLAIQLRNLIVNTIEEVQNENKGGGYSFNDITDNITTTTTTNTTTTQSKTMDVTTKDMSSNDDYNNDNNSNKSNNNNNSEDNQNSNSFSRELKQLQVQINIQMKRMNEELTNKIERTKNQIMKLIEGETHTINLIKLDNDLMKTKLSEQDELLKLGSGIGSTGTGIDSSTSLDYKRVTETVRKLNLEQMEALGKVCNMNIMVYNKRYIF